MNRKMSKRQRDIKSKLMAAICMLLVSSIMMVSTTYAWFTLSTAPEVTGIQTAVGANGNLEMALLPTSGLTSDIKTEVGDSMNTAGKTAQTANITWGNLVDLSQGYGFDQITLFPAQLNAATNDAEGNPETLEAALLSTPKYGIDGRITELAKNTVTSTFVDGSFPQNNQFGVRAVGVASGMTDRQLAYRNAASAATTAMAQAKNTAATSLNTNGNALANIAIAHGTGATTHDVEDVDALLRIVNDLLGVSNVVSGADGAAATVTRTPEVEGALEYIEQAYIQSILAYGASQAAVDAGMDDGEFILFKGVVDGAASLADVKTELEKYGVFLPGAASGPIDNLNASIAKVEQAKIKLEALKTNGGTGTDKAIVWNDLSPALTLLADPDALEINGIKANEIMDKVNDLIKTVSSGLTVTMSSGGGVYADIADHCGDYNASIVIAEIKYGTLEVTDMPARMATNSSVKPAYLSVLTTEVAGAGSPTSADGTTKPLTDMYGYIIDLAFRTNAAESDLLLQQEGVDRIYSENGNVETMGHGSVMTLKSTTTDFTNDMVKELMKAIRIVFFQKDGNKVLATAKLDAEHATQGADGLTAKMYLYEVTKGGDVTYEVLEGEFVAGNEYYTATTTTTSKWEVATGLTEENFGTTPGLHTMSEVDGESVYTAVGSDATYNASTTYYTQVNVTSTDYTKYPGTEAPAEGTTLYVKKVTAAGENKLTDNVITALTQNQAVQVSALVYLDGNHVGNEDVAATAATSVTGTMNLQFASSATLVPMEYADLHQPVSGTPLTAITVNGQADATGTFNEKAVTINLVAKTGNTLKGVTVVSVDGTALAATDYKYSNGKLTFEKEGIAANTAIAITVDTEAVTGT